MCVHTHTRALLATRCLDSYQHSRMVGTANTMDQRRIRHDDSAVLRVDNFFSCELKFVMYTDQKRITNPTLSPSIPSNLTTVLVILCCEFYINFLNMSHVHCKGLEKTTGAPRRFKTAFMFYSIDKQREIRSDLKNKGIVVRICPWCVSSCRNPSSPNKRFSFVQVGHVTSSCKSGICCLEGVVESGT